jgi:hypothetical protein
MHDETTVPERGGGRGSVALFALIAALMATDVTIEFRSGVAVALQTFEIVICALALAGIGFHWWQMVAARLRSRQLDEELARVKAEAHQWSEDARREYVICRIDIRRVTD